MPDKNENGNEKMRNWELQQKQKSQQDLRDQNEHMNDKYRHMKNNYISFNNVHKDEDEAIYRNISDLADKNSYMRYELNNTFDDKDDKKKINKDKRA